MHIPVLLKEVIEILDPKPGEVFIDGTFGGGGHSKLIWEKIKPNGKLLAVDWNSQAVNECGRQKHLVCAEGNFADLPDIVADKNLPKADGLLIDLGLSSDELESSGRGFSFLKDEPLLMTYSDRLRSVREIISQINAKQLENIIKSFGEERFAGRIAKSIKEMQKKNPIRTTFNLVEAIRLVVPKNYERGRIHPATRTFMALRIYANKELDNLTQLLNNLESILKKNGRAAIISFHSLEDRLVKNKFRELAKEDRVELLTKKPIIPSEEEILKNPRARSAKLRAIKFI